MILNMYNVCKQDELRGWGSGIVVLFMFNIIAFYDCTWN